MTIKISKFEDKQSKIKNFLKAYSVIVFVLLFVVSGIILFNSQFGVQSQEIFPCSGACGSGPECNEAGSPGANNTWSCLPEENVGDSDTGFTCQRTPASTCTYTDDNCNSGLECGCGPAIEECEQKCESYFAGQPGEHEYFNQDGPAYQCENCGQVVACRCVIPEDTPTPTPPSPDGCPYEDGQFGAAFSNDNGINWVAGPGYNGWENIVNNFQCGDSLDASPVDFLAGGEPTLTGFEFRVNGQLITSNLPISVTATEENPTINISAIALREDGTQYSEANCQDQTTITCISTESTPTPTPGAPGCNEVCDENRPCSDGQVCNFDATDNPNTGRCRIPEFPEERDCSVDHEIEKDIVTLIEEDTQEVRFRVRMTNTSDDSTYDDITFRDEFDRRELRLIGLTSCNGFDGCITRTVRNTTDGQDRSVTFGVRFLSSGRAEIINNNLAADAGPLGPGEQYIVEFRFNYLTEDFENCVYWEPEDLGEKRDCASTTVVIPTKDTDL